MRVGVHSDGSVMIPESWTVNADEPSTHIGIRPARAPERHLRSKVPHMTKGFTVVRLGYRHDRPTMDLNLGRSIIRRRCHWYAPDGEDTRVRRRVASVDYRLRCKSYEFRRCRISRVVTFRDGRAPTADNWTSEETREAVTNRSSR